MTEQTSPWAALSVSTDVFKAQNRAASTLGHYSLAAWIRTQDVIAAWVQMKLAANPYQRVLEQLARHDSLMPRTARALASHNFLSVRRDLARNPSTPLDVLEVLLRDPRDVVRGPAYAHPNVGPDVVEEAIINKDDAALREVLKSIRSSITDEQVGRLLVEDPTHILDLAADRHITDEGIEAVLNAGRDLWSLLARSKTLSLELSLRLFEDGTACQFQLAGASPHAEIRSRLLTSKLPNTVRALLSNESLTREEFLVIEGAQASMEHPDALGNSIFDHKWSSEDRIREAYEAGNNGMRARLAQVPNFPIDLHERAFHEGTSKQGFGPRLTVVRNPGLDPETIEKWIIEAHADNDVRVMRQLVRHPHAEVSERWPVAALMLNPQLERAAFADFEGDSDTLISLSHGWKGTIGELKEVARRLGPASE